jgi:hypothetical protein
MVGDVVEDLFDVAFRCWVADIVEFRKEDVAMACGELESVGGEERHLDWDERGLEVVGIEG